MRRYAVYKNVTTPAGFDELCPFKMFHFKILSALYLYNRKEFFSETWYKFKISTDDIQRRKNSAYIFCDNFFFLSNISPVMSPKFLRNHFSFLYVVQT